MQPQIFLCLKHGSCIALVRVVNVLQLLDQARIEYIKVWRHYHAQLELNRDEAASGLAGYAGLRVFPSIDQQLMGNWLLASIHSFAGGWSSTCCVSNASLAQRQGRLCGSDHRTSMAAQSLGNYDAYLLFLLSRLPWRKKSHGNGIMATVRNASKLDPHWLPSF
ncbi:hypothetical protein SCAR479_04269 [Seiridium cardinale]|uniref:Uncharacterized protein n=1 Tax=Seiridium cardinale TaxID=138064 RepID=A0ABR2XYZ9_9PEZI